jgi:hypothetical protein
MELDLVAERIHLVERVVRRPAVGQHAIGGNHESRAIRSGLAVDENDA